MVGLSPKSRRAVAVALAPWVSTNRHPNRDSGLKSESHCHREHPRTRRMRDLRRRGTYKDQIQEAAKVRSVFAESHHVHAALAQLDVNYAPVSNNPDPTND